MFHIIFNNFILYLIFNVLYYILYYIECYLKLDYILNISYICSICSCFNIYDVGKYHISPPTQSEYTCNILMNKINFNYSPLKYSLPETFFSVTYLIVEETVWR